MRNFLQPGNVVDVTVPRNVASGDGLFKGKLFGIVTVDAKSGATVPVLVEGVVSLKRAVGFSMVEGNGAVFDEASQTLISGAGTTVGYVVEPVDPDDATRALVKLIATAA